MSWDRLTELFEQALALPADQRADFLAEHCAGDDVLRGEIESLLAAYGPARTFFGSLEAGVVGPSMGRLLDGSAAIPSGTVVGCYEIEAPIGGGGMGVVYRAHDRRLDRTVALKFIAPELTNDKTARNRLLREARAAAALDDPRIGAIHAIEEAPDGRLFLVMPYYAGETLKDRLARGRLDTAQAVHIAIELAEGLARAHRAGIVHRDIKPANVLITSDGAVKILDFGIARVTAGAGATSSASTLGTAAYMAPERVRGETADPRADLWSLGVVLYEMLAGTRPFQGDSEPAVLYAVLEATPPPLHTHAPDLPAALEQLVERLLRKDAADRPADASDVADNLRRLDRDPGPASETAASNRTATATVTGRAWLSRRVGSGRRRIAAIALLVTAMAAAAFVITRNGDAAAPDSYSIAVLPFVVRGDPELNYLSDGLVHLLSTKLDGVGDLRPVDPHMLLAAYGSAPADADPAMGREAAARFYASAFVLGAVLRIGTAIELSASLYGADGRLQATASAMTKMDSDLSSAIDELVRGLVAHRLTGAGERLGGLAAMTTHSLPALRAYLEGEHLLRTGHPTAALSAFQSAVALDSTFGLAWYRLARAAGWIGPAELNEDAAARAVRFGGTLPERTRSLVAAYRVFRTGDPLEAERLYRRLLSSYPDDMEALELLGETLFHNNPFFGRPTAEAREYLEHALAMDPENRELMVHLMDLAAAEGRTADVDSLTARYRGQRNGGEIPTALHAYDALRTLVLDRDAGYAKALDDLAVAGPDALTDALVRVAPQLRDPQLSARIAGLLAHPANPPAARANGQLHSAWLAVARGQSSAASEHWQAAAALQPDWTLILHVLAATLPHSTASLQELDSLRAAVVAWTPPAALQNGLHRGDLRVVRTYLLGLLAWHGADDAGAASAIGELTRLAAAEDGVTVNTGATPDLARALAATLQALQHWRAERPAETLAALDRAELRMPFHRRSHTPLLEQHLNRFIRAESLRALGAGDAEADEAALRFYTSLEDGYYHWGAPFVGPALIGTAEIHERRGNVSLAAAAYQRFLTLWQDADPALQPWLDLARERLDRLRS